MFTFDCETSKIAPGYQFPALSCVSTASGDLYDHVQGPEVWAAALERADLIVGANTAFDMLVCVHERPDLWPALFEAYDQDRVTDVLERQRLIDIRKGELDFRTLRNGKRAKHSYSLDDTYFRHTGQRLTKDPEIRLAFGPLRGTDPATWPERFRTYASDDAIATDTVYRCQEDPGPDEFRAARGALFLKLVSGWGICTDPAKVREFATAIRQEELGLRRALQEMGLVRPDRVVYKGKPNQRIERGSRNEKAIRDRIQAHHPDPPRTDPSKTFPEGQIQISAEVCEETTDPGLQLLGKYLTTAAVLSKDVPMLERGCIHSHFKTLVRTGRTSSSNPNIQNIRRLPGIRECFRPSRPGWVFVFADYGSLELFTWAQVCTRLLGFSKLGELLRGGLDPHLEMGATLLGIGYQEALERKAAKDVYVLDARQLAKVLNFGFPGGMGGRAFVAHAKSQGHHIELAEAYQLKDHWLRTWPEAQPYLDYIGALFSDPYWDGTITHLFSGRVRGDLSYSSAANSFFQGLGSDIGKAAGYQIVKGIYRDQVPARPVNFIHDEYGLECPESYAHEIAMWLVQQMETEARRWLPDVPTIKAEPTIMRYWSKKAFSEPGPDGRLTIWSG